ncbi:MAG: hypothetical protein KFF72_05410, partial [Arthrospira sp. SH-MAG29]
FAVADNIVPDHPRIRDRSVYLLVAIHPLPASEEGEFRNILLKRVACCNICANMGSHSDRHSDPLREAVMLLNVKKRGNSLSVIVPKEMAINMNIDDGDSLFATKTPSGYEISPYDPNFVKKIEAARRGMKKYRNALIELAK